MTDRAEQPTLLLDLGSYPAVVSKSVPEPVGIGSQIGIQSDQPGSIAVHRRRGHFFSLIRKAILEQTQRINRRDEAMRIALLLVRFQAAPPVRVKIVVHNMEEI